MPAESKKSAETVTAGQSAPAPAKSKPAANSGKAAQAKVTLLDGSVLDVAIDVRSSNCNHNNLYLKLFLFSFTA